MTETTPQFGQVTDAFPFGYGYCQCGCGRKVSPSYDGSYPPYYAASHHPRNRNRRDRASNSPEAKRLAKLDVGVLGEVKTGYEHGWGYCQCGCGAQTTVTRGRAARFVAGHSSRTPEARQRQSEIGTALLQSRSRNGFPDIGRSKQGQYFSSKLERTLNYMSTYEKTAFEILDDIPTISSYEEQPFSVSYEYHGRKRQYTPDLLLRFRDDRKALVEVKPRSRIRSGRNQAKTAAVVAYCRQKGVGFMIWTEDFLLGQAYKRRVPSDGDDEIARFSALDHIEHVLGIRIEDIRRFQTERVQSDYMRYHPRA